MAEQTGEQERLVSLSGRSLGDATAHVLDLARRFGYSVAATAPGTYRLARERRRGLRKRNEWVVVTILDDRSGTKARIVGPVDPALLEHLAPASAANGQSPASPPLAGPAPSLVPSTHPAPAPAPAAPAPADPPPIARLADRPAAVAPPSGGMISGVPGAVPRAAPDTAPAATRHDDDTTVERQLRPPSVATPQSVDPALVFPGGRSIRFTEAVVFGRDPDLGRGPTGAVPVAVDEPSLSKTHAYVVPGSEVTVTDLHSTNGTTVVAGSTGTVCPPGEPVVVPAGAHLVAGTVSIEVVQ